MGRKKCICMNVEEREMSDDKSSTDELLIRLPREADIASSSVAHRPPLYFLGVSFCNFY